MTYYLQLFFVFSLGGWIADTAYRSFLAKKYAPGTLLPYISPIYGFGAVMLALVFRGTPDVPPTLQIAIGWVLILLLEFITGHLSVKFLNRRLWDYTPSKYDLFGHVDLTHALYWMILISLFRLFFDKIQF